MVTLLVIGLMLGGIGAWTVAQPNGGYRPAAGLGSSFSPSTRRMLGAIYATLGALAVVALVARVAR